MAYKRKPPPPAVTRAWVEPKTLTLTADDIPGCLKRTLLECFNRCAHMAHLCFYGDVNAGETWKRSPVHTVGTSVYIDNIQVRALEGIMGGSPWARLQVDRAFLESLFDDVFSDDPEEVKSRRELEHRLGILGVAEGISHRLQTDQVVTTVGSVTLKFNANNGLIELNVELRVAAPNLGPKF